MTASGYLGCPRGDATSTAGQNPYDAQDFVSGRIYSWRKGTYYVIEPFRDAIDKLNFVSEYGLPASDPVDPRSFADYAPVLWQRFELGPELLSTMEVTDNPLTLWVAVPDIDGVKRAEGDEATISPRTATTWLSFPCDQPDAPCSNLKKPQPASYLPYSAMENAASGQHYNFWTLTYANEWPVLYTHELFSFEGNIKTSGRAGEDNPLTHDCSVGLSWDGVDWTVDAIPYPGFEGMLGEKQNVIEFEYEYCLGAYPEPNDPNDPSKGVKAELLSGDKLFVAGRWIVDAGHDYVTEIHPPAVMIDIYTGFKESAPGYPTTIGDLFYLDWWYPLQTAEVNIYPPPRPQAGAKLQVSAPYDRNLCPTDPTCGIQVTFEPWSAPNHIHVKFSGRPDIFNNPPREDPDGQLHYGLALPTGGRAVLPDGYGHMLPLLGQFAIGWTQAP